MRRTTRVLLLFGGRSSEHDVSCLSARNVLRALDRRRYVVMTVGITRDGRWTLVDGVADTPAGVLPHVPDDGDTVALAQTRKGPLLVRFDDDLRGEQIGPVDVCFPVLHGPYGEDGTVQGLLASYGVPYVGADVASSAVCIDKPKMKSVFTALGLPQTRYECVARSAWDHDRDAVLNGILDRFGFPLFSKPGRQGSSIGISRCDDRGQLLAGIVEAFNYDRVAIVEQGLEGIREIECGVLGNERLAVTRPGETVHAGRFYDFQAKYLAPVQLHCPADVPEPVRQTCMDYARRACEAIGVRGMARVDFFYLPDSQQVLINEINTIPGLTPTSMFPPAWAAEGLKFPQVVDRLLELALQAAETDARYAP